MMRKAHLAVIAVLIAIAVSPCHAASPVTVSGQVCDSAGVPQIGAQVLLLRPDLSVVASVYTNSQGRFLITSLLPGHYALKAMGPSFLPSLRENIKVRGATVVNLTLNTLYEVIQWLPAQPRTGSSQQDDWSWTLRSAANRPLLRWLEDGPLVVVSDGPGKLPKLKARLMAIGQDGTFGESGERYTAIVNDTPSNSRELLARVDFAPGTDANMESMLGFSQDLGFAGSVQSMAAISLDPQIEGASGAGLSEAAADTRETLRLNQAIEAEVGSTAVIARLGGSSPSTVTAALPFAKVQWRGGNTAIHYRVATAVPGRGYDESSSAWMPSLSQRNGTLALEHGLHHEIGWERNTNSSRMAVLVYSDTVENPVLQALGRFTSQNFDPSPNMLFDRRSDLLRAAGPDFSSAGIRAVVERRLPGGNHVRLSYASGDALVMPALQHPVTLDEALAKARPHHAQTYSIALSGILDGTGTRWRASYSWQADDTVTAVAPFAQDALGPFFGLHVRQPIRLMRDGSGGIEALFDARNLLAEGYRPYMLSDGSLLLFARDQQSLRAGLAFTF